MTYISRSATKVIQEITRTFPALVLTGARQVGKSTLLKHMFPNVPYITLDDPNHMGLANDDPQLFLQQYEKEQRLIIDEIQYAPSLARFIKIIIDREPGRHGRFLLTGSQKWSLIKNLGESLAGRVGIVHLPNLTAIEIASYIPNDKDTPYEVIFKGAYPKLYQSPPPSQSTFYSSYIESYLQRDVRDILDGVNLSDFMRFLKIVAARTSQLLNKSNIAQDTGISRNVIDNWLGALEISGLIFLLQPYSTQVTKRLTRTPKIYFLDSGLAAYLTGHRTAEMIEDGPMSGALLENWVISELVKSYWNQGINDPPLSYLRDQNKAEIDVLIETPEGIFPIEIKRTTKADKKDIKWFDKIPANKQGHGTLMCLVEDFRPITRDASAIPILAPKQILKIFETVVKFVDSDTASLYEAIGDSIDIFPSWHDVDICDLDLINITVQGRYHLVLEASTDVIFRMGSSREEDGVDIPANLPTTIKANVSFNLQEIEVEYTFDTAAFERDFYGHNEV